MTMRTRRALLLASLATLACATVLATDAAVDLSDVQPVGVVGEPAGSGPMPAVAEAVADLRDNTLYHPAKMPEGRLPLLLWGEGGCRDNGLRYAQFLREIASHGYFIVAGGYPRHERALAPPGTPPAPRPAADAPKTPEELRDTTVDELLSAVDWAQKQTDEPNSPLYRRIDTTRIGVMGHSCGGLQAIAIATDPRVHTAIAFNSGVLIRLPPGAPANANLVVAKSALQELQGPIAYINGGPTDIAYENAEDDFRLIEHQPVFFAENGVGHGGTYLHDERGGDYSAVAVAWMDWQLKGDAQAAHWFVGSDCVLCTRAGWKVQKKNFPPE